MRKEHSSNHVNEKEILLNCGLAFTLKLISGRWKPTIIWRLNEGVMRYKDLLQSIGNISEKMLAAQLKELEQAGLIHREVFPEVPPRVEYGLTEQGKSLIPLLEGLTNWGIAMQGKL
ncbi:transcriptional regulator [Chitinophaga caeni]|uniref:Transcriptional regulator n=1 Tax=Chitinophaga caeni TaxID=2029983 RepID=A0A291QYX6_9BACT|nr:helix-turn-helix domain-containing protein [Chitinophaga caeni]ATL49160.1 transcriptional regulator [Chitinophaga caeni]